MSRTIKEAWTDYERYYAKGFAVVAKKDLPVYKQLTGNYVISTIKKDHKLLLNLLQVGINQE